MKRFFVYILATRKNGPLYVGVTSNLGKRIFEHKSRAVPGYTRKYNIDRLVWFEPHETSESAIIKEKQLKKWRRTWKDKLIETENPDWLDLYKVLEPE